MQQAKANTVRPCNRRDIEARCKALRHDPCPLGHRPAFVALAFPWLVQNRLLDRLTVTVQNRSRTMRRLPKLTNLHLAGHTGRHPEDPQLTQIGRQSRANSGSPPGGALAPLTFDLWAIELRPVRLRHTAESLTRRPSARHKLPVIGACNAWNELVGRNGSGNVVAWAEGAQEMTLSKGGDIPNNFAPVHDSFAYVKRGVEVPMRDGVKLMILLP